MVSKSKFVLQHDTIFVPYIVNDEEMRDMCEGWLNNLNIKERRAFNVILWQIGW